MAQKNALMEWLEQTKKISKMVDYLSCDTIDTIIHYLPYIDRKMILIHKGFFDHFCEYYHKPNPVRMRRIKRGECFPCDPMTLFVQSSIIRCQKAMNDVTWQWFEIIDFMFERPELVNPSLIDDYIKQKVSETCRNQKKNNPLRNGMWGKFGKKWKDKKGKWRNERRQRF